ncbi:MAG TPA: PEP-CTERM sorting domain-containing protein [Coleofasciculaceae cyanobacterium]
MNVVADENTPVPGGIGNFDYFRSSSLANGNVAFFGFASTLIGNDYTSQQGIYTNIGGSLNVVADLDTPVPGGQGNFVTFDYPVLDQNGNVAFKGFESFFSQQGIYTNIGSSLNVVADTNTAIPDGTKNFQSFGNFSFDNENIVFLGSSAEFASEVESGIYTNISGSLEKVLAYGDSLDGKTIRGLNIGRQALSGNQIALLANFTDDSSGIYVATTTSETPVPEPSSVLGVLAMGALGAGWRLRRKQQ